MVVEEDEHEQQEHQEEEEEHWAQDTVSSWDSIVESASSPVDSSPRSTDSEGGFPYDTVSGDSDELCDEEATTLDGAPQAFCDF